jgi:hypothetical protein
MAIAAAAAWLIGSHVLHIYYTQNIVSRSELAHAELQEPHHVGVYVQAVSAYQPLITADLKQAVWESDNLEQRRRMELAAQQQANAEEMRQTYDDGGDMVDDFDSHAVGDDIMRILHMQQQVDFEKLRDYEHAKHSPLLKRIYSEMLQGGEGMSAAGNLRRVGIANGNMELPMVTGYRRLMLWKSRDGQLYVNMTAISDAFLPETMTPTCSIVHVTPKEQDLPATAIRSKYMQWDILQTHLLESTYAVYRVADQLHADLPHIERHFRMRYSEREASRLLNSYKQFVESQQTRKRYEREAWQQAANSGGLLNQILRQREEKSMYERCVCSEHVGSITPYVFVCTAESVCTLMIAPRLMPQTSDELAHLEWKYSDPRFQAVLTQLQAQLDVKTDERLVMPPTPRVEYYVMPNKRDMEFFYGFNIANTGVLAVSVDGDRGVVRGANFTRRAMSHGGGGGGGGSEREERDIADTIERWTRAAAAYVWRIGRRYFVKSPEVDRRMRIQDMAHARRLVETVHRERGEMLYEKAHREEIVNQIRAEREHRRQLELQFAEFQKQNGGGGDNNLATHHTASGSSGSGGGGDSSAQLAVSGTKSTVALVNDMRLNVYERIQRWAGRQAQQLQLANNPASASAEADRTMAACADLKTRYEDLASIPDETLLAFGSRCIQWLFKPPALVKRQETVRGITATCFTQCHRNSLLLQLQNFCTNYKMYARDVPTVYDAVDSACKATQSVLRSGDAFKFWIDPYYSADMFGAE